MSAWGWPQWVMATLYTMNVVIALRRHGEPSRGKDDFWAALAITTLIAITLHAGGFW